MSFLEFASYMYPYWLFGIAMFWAIYKSEYKDILSFNIKSFIKFFIFMAVISTWRYFSIKALANHGVSLDSLKATKILPIGAVFFTPWEDLCHVAPLLVLRKLIGTSKWVMPIHFLATICIMISFGIGHLYQGIFSAMMLSLYIPFGVRLSKNKGLGTLMAGHVLYDFSTLMIIRAALSIL